jgi:putative phosphoribosyl transferase
MRAAAAEPVAIAVADGHQIEADLYVPSRATGLIIFAHGSGSSRFSSRNRAVATALHARRLGTLLLDLLTREEEAADARGGDFRFDIERLSGRMIAATDWVTAREDLASLPIGYFGASTGAAAAITAAAERPGAARAVVSRGGRPDLAGVALTMIAAPTLLIVGGEDSSVIDLNREALENMRGAHVELALIPGATHLFPEAGALAQVEKLAGEWFVRYLGQPST